MLLTACSGSITDPKKNEPDGTGLSYRPNITLINFNGERGYQAGASYAIRFKVSDDVMGVNENVLYYKSDNQNDWTLIKDKVLSSSDVLTEVLWKIPDELNGVGFKIKIVAYGKIPAMKTVESETSFTIDNQAPTLSPSGLSIQSLESGNPYTFLKLLKIQNASDNLSGIGGICLNDIIDSTLSESNSCWINRKLLDLNEIPFYSGFQLQTFDLNTELMDGVGNVRTRTNVSNTDQITVSQTAVTIPSGNLSFLNATLALDIGQISSSYQFVNLGSFTNKTLNPGTLVVLPDGSVLVKNSTQGLIKIDLKKVKVDGSWNCTTGNCVQTLFGVSTSSVDGDSTIGKLVDPIKMYLDAKGILWILDRKSVASNELLIRKIDFNQSPVELKTVIGGGSEESDSIDSALKIKLTYSEALKYFGTFQSLPNGWFVFNSQSPEKFLGIGNGSYQLRVFKPNEPNQISTIYLDPNPVWNSGGINSGKGLLAFSSAVISYDSDLLDIKSIRLRVCRTDLTINYSNNCDQVNTLGFNSLGKGVSELGISTPVNDGNLNLFSDNGKDIYALSGSSSEVKKYNSSSNTWDSIIGTGVRASSYCDNATTNSSCSLRLNDAYYLNSMKILFVLDHQKIRILTPDTTRIYSLIQ